MATANESNSQESVSLVENHRQEESVEDGTADVRNDKPNNGASHGASNGASNGAKHSSGSRPRTQSFYRSIHFAEEFLCSVDTKASDVTPGDWEFPFENLVLEGGGCKGLAYAGLLRCLEKVGIRDQLKRFAGASAGAMAATFIALGFSADEMEELLAVNMEELFVDHKCGLLSLLSSIPRLFGWNPAKKFYNWMSQLIASRSMKNDPAMTFSDLYEERKVELCIVITNLNLNRTVFCHPKTTPDMPIRDAVRMSMSIPIFFTAFRYSTPGTDRKDIFVDGGVLENYPINCFDGWGLSMDPQNSFIKKLHPFEKIGPILEKQFQGYNEKTMGAVLYSDDERDFLRYNLEKRKGANEPLKPEIETKLSKSKSDHMDDYENTMTDQSGKIAAMNAFLSACDKHDDGVVNYITRERLSGALSELGLETKELLFGEENDVDSVITHFDKSGNGKVSLQEILYNFDKSGAKVMDRIYGFGRKEINGFLGFAKSIYESASLKMTMSIVKSEDEARSIGINTGHVGTMDFQLEQADKDFALARGFNATKAFLQYFVVHNPKLVQSRESSASNM